LWIYDFSIEPPTWLTRRSSGPAQKAAQPDHLYVRSKRAMSPHRVALVLLLSLFLNLAQADVVGPPSANISLVACIAFDENATESNAAGKSAFEALVNSLPKGFPLYAASVHVTSSSADTMRRDLDRILSGRQMLRNAGLVVTEISTYQAFYEGRQYERSCGNGTPRITLYASRKALPSTICDRHYGCEVRCQGSVCVLEK